MSKERLEGINRNILDIKKNSLAPNEVLTWSGWKSVLPIFTEDLEHLQEQAELTQHFAQKNGELNEFLQKYIEPKNLGRNVIDVAMRIIKEQAERGIYNEQALINQEMSSDREIERMRKQNKRYRKAIERIKGAPRKAHSGSDCVDIIFEIIEELESESECG